MSGSNTLKTTQHPPQLKITQSEACLNKCVVSDYERPYHCKRPALAILKKSNCAAKLCREKLAYPKNLLLCLACVGILAI